MCGIAGFVDSSRTSSADELLATVDRMSDQMIHRGPDDGGAWVDPITGVALGHRRLSILDLSPEGHQPMISADGGLVIVFNGEIYNFAELRRSLESNGHRFRGRSDTEVLLAGMCEWGFERTLKRAVGMFAIALWDKRARKLWLARDRMGEKPLYYGWQNGTFIFCSDLRALRAHPKWLAEVDRNSVALMMRYGYIPAPYSIYRNIRKLTPGGFLQLDCENLVSGTWPVPREYWSAREHAQSSAANPFCGTDAEAITELDRTLREAVGLQMVADVPLGAFLSGGIDSSTVVALMQAQSSRPVKTFSIGFHEEDYNEARHAKAVARHLGTDHTELYVTPAEAIAVIPSLPEIYTEPFADSSQIPTCLVARLARRHVTVSLSGDGGDELFCGYSRYEAAVRVWNRIGRMPQLARTGLSALVGISPVALLNLALRFHDRSLGKRFSQPRNRHDWNAIGRMLQYGEGEFYQGYLSYWLEPSELVARSREPSDALTDRLRWPDLADFRRRMMYIDAVSYLPDDILVKVDRAAMAVSLETRVPLLDHRVVEFAWRLPTRLMYREGQGKWLLRQVLQQYVPKQLVERPKMGFGVPLDSWLRGPLRDWADALLATSRLKGDGYFDAAVVRQKWDEHLSGRVDQQHPLWDVLMFQSWLDTSRAPIASGAPVLAPVLASATVRPRLHRKPKVRVAFLIRRLDRGGAERQLIKLASSLNKNKFDVTILTFYPGGNSASEITAETGINVICLNKTGRWDVVLFLRRLLRTVRELRPQIIHGYMSGANELSILAGRACGARVIWGLRSSDRRMISQTRIDQFLFRAGAWLSGQADRVIANSEDGRSYHAAEGYAGARMIVVPNGIDTQLFAILPQARETVRREWNISGAEILIGRAARLDPLKDYPSFLKAAATVSRRHPNVKFACIGDDTDCAQLREVAAGEGIAQRIVWANGRSDMPAVYNALDICVSSSLSEGFPNAIAEPMACGTPCVATNVGDSALIVGAAGVIVPAGDPVALADGMLDLIANRQHYSRERVRRRITDNFALERMVGRTEAEFQQLLGLTDAECERVVA